VVATKAIAQSHVRELKQRRPRLKLGRLTVREDCMGVLSLCPFVGVDVICDRPSQYTRLRGKKTLNDYIHTQYYLCIEAY